MNRFSSQRIRLLLAAIAFAMTLSASVASPARVSSNGSRAQEFSRQLEARKNPNLILFKRGWLDTRASDVQDTSGDDSQAHERVSSSSIPRPKLTRVIQFAGPPRSEWIERLRAAGVEIVGYIPNNAYIVRGGESELARTAAFHGGRSANAVHPIQWMGRLDPLNKVDPAFGDELLASRGSGNVSVEIELAASVDASNTIANISSLASRVDREPWSFLSFIVLSISLPVDQLMAVAALDDVLFIGPVSEAKPLDERSAQIIAGNLIADLTQPVGPGYSDWLHSLGLDAVPDFLVDVTDSGLDRGQTSSGVHPDLRETNGTSRVSYSKNYTTDGAQDQSGHGSIVTSIIGGKGSSDYEDALGYMYGLGVEPSAKLGISRIFDSQGRLPFQLSFTAVASAAYAAGARMVNNSWGNGGNSYDAAAQEYDELVRDARPSMSGNQEMTFVFSAGNSGPGGHVSSPGTAKNVITVGASENYRPEGTDSCNLDGGGGIGADGADSVLDILRYSSGGPTADGRSKPDMVAPGTHIYGGASQASPFVGDGLCPGVPFFQPPGGQHLYTWSSGTSMAAPHVTGAAALVRKFFTTRQLLPAGQPPSPAMTKAFLINSAGYMTGENAGGDLPDARQGWGRVDLSRAFDGAHRLLLDQSTLFTEIGQTFEVRGSLADRSLPLRITLTWTDVPGMLAGPGLVNDLDLEIKIGDATVYRGNSFDGRWSVQDGEPDRLNNVESVFLPADAIPTGVAGNFTIIVRAANIPGDGVPGNEALLDQDFALVVDNVGPAGGIDPPPDPVPFITAVTYVKKRLVISGRDFTASAQLEINGKIIDKSFDFDGATNSIRFPKLKYKKLNLKKDTDNQIVLIEKNERSQPFILRI